MAKAIHPDVPIGHVHLKVADLDRGVRFHRDVLGFELTQRYSNQAAFLSAGGCHRHIGLNTWDSECGSPPPLNSTGLYHLAIAYPTPSRADEFFELAFASKAPQIMGYARPFISATPMVMGWSFTGINPESSCRNTDRVHSRWSSFRSTSWHAHARLFHRHCCLHSDRRETGVTLRRAQTDDLGKLDCRPIHCAVNVNQRAHRAIHDSRHYRLYALWPRPVLLCHPVDRCSSFKCA